MVGIFFRFGEIIDTIEEVWPIVIIAIILLTTVISIWLAKNSEITVTNKRVYGITIKRTRVDLPIDSISAVGVSWFNGIDVGTSSGQLHFKLIENNNQIQNEINKLLLNRQEKKHVTEEKISTTEKLKEYKGLLDSGVITKEEFEKKKKQLLNL